MKKANKIGNAHLSTMENEEINGDDVDDLELSTYKPAPTLREIKPSCQNKPVPANDQAEELDFWVERCLDEEKSCFVSKQKPRRIRAKTAQMRFNNQCTRKGICEDYKNGIVKTHTHLYLEEGYEDEAIAGFVFDRVNGTERHEMSLPEDYLDFDVLDFRLAVHALEYCHRNDVRALVLLETRTILEWFKQGEVSHLFQLRGKKANNVDELEDAVNCLEEIGVNYLLGIEVNNYYEVYSPETNDTFIINSR